MPPNNQLASDGVFTYEYDNEGNRIRRTRISGGAVTTYEGVIASDSSR
ncbi:hypothetical protein PN498_16975 [Oscillatoria sp. CS-180]|nr:hypothetical protein [Oscillatoria sp. CS-180]MDB9527691.1 hypothetical protein [Oscillatoria sp. CS-180]